MISIIIPFYNKFELVHARLGEFMRFVQTDDVEILLIDDGSSENVDPQVAFWQKQAGQHKIRYLKNETNMGFGYSMNRGAEKANGDILVFFSDDVIIGSDFLSEISYLLAGEDDVLVGGELLDGDTGWNKFSDTLVPYLAGWLLACTKKSWEKLGGFDLRYGLSDYEDIDLSLTATQMGFRLIPIRTSNVKHLGGQTAPYNEYRRARTLKNKAKFMEKWGLHE